MKLKSLLKEIMIKRKQYQSLFSNHILQESLVEKTSNDSSKTTERDDVLSKIKNNDWEKPQNPKSFKKSMGLSKHKEMLSPYSTSELSQMKLYKLNGYNIGFALKKKDGDYKEIVAVHNNEPNVKGIGEELMRSAIKKGGCYLDHFDGYLSGFYSGLGFEEIDRDKFDPQYDADGNFRKKYGESDVIYRKHKNCK